MDSATVAALGSSAAVPMTMPRTSPIAQPVRQCRVACAAVDHATDVQPPPPPCSVCVPISTRKELIPPMGMYGSSGSSGLPRPRRLRLQAYHPTVADRVHADDRLARLVAR